MSLYTAVLRKIDSCSCKKAVRMSGKTVEKAMVVKAGAYIVSIDRKTTVLRLEACEFAFLENACFSCPLQCVPVFH